MLLLKVISQHFGQIYSDQIWLSRLATAASSNISEDIGHFLFSETVVPDKINFPRNKRKICLLED
jgi:hypothetical protein